MTEATVKEMMELLLPTEGVVLVMGIQVESSPVAAAVVVAQESLNEASPQTVEVLAVIVEISMTSLNCTRMVGLLAVSVAVDKGSKDSTLG